MAKTRAIPGTRRRDATAAAAPSGPSYSRLLPLASALTGALAALIAFHPVTDPDFWHHMSFARQLVFDGGVPRADTLSHTAMGAPWVSSGWLSSLLLYGLFQSFGTAGPVGATAMVAALAFTVPALVAWRMKSPLAWMIAALAVLGVLSGYMRFNPRPDIFSIALMPALILLMMRAEQDLKHAGRLHPVTILMFPLLIFLWANLHALSVIGAALVVLFALLIWKQRGLPAFGNRRIYLVALLLTPLVLLLTPYGWRLVWFVWANAELNDAGKRIFELKPLLAGASTGEVPQHLLWSWAALALGAGYLGWIQRKQMPTWRWGMLVLLVALALLQRRQVGLAAAGIPLLLVLPGAPPLRPKWLGPALFGFVLILALGLRFTGSLETAGAKPSAAIDCRWFPCEAARFLKENPPPGKAFHDLYTGSFLGWNLGPEQKVFIDGRLEVFNRGPYEDYFAPPEGRLPLKAVFDKYDIGWCLLDVRGAAANPGHTARQLLARQHEWALVYKGEQYGVFVRRGQGEAGDRYIRQFEVALSP